MTFAFTTLPNSYHSLHKPKCFIKKIQNKKCLKNRSRALINYFLYLFTAKQQHTYKLISKTKKKTKNIPTTTLPSIKSCNAHASICLLQSHYYLTPYLPLNAQQQLPHTNALTRDRLKG